MSRNFIEFGLNWRWRAERFRACSDAPDQTVLGAYAGERAVGFSIMAFGKHDAHLLLMAVMPRYRRKGVARAMLNWFEVSMRATGLARTFVELRTQNENALAFYHSAGFRMTAELLNYYDGRENAYRMVRELSADFGNGEHFYSLPGEQDKRLVPHSHPAGPKPFDRENS